MKKVSKILLVSFITIMLLVFSVYAEESTQDLVTLDAVSNGDLDPNMINSQNAEIVESDLCECDEKLEITKVVNGNAYLMAQDVTVKDSSISGNLFVLGENVKITNTDISGSVYVLAQNLEFSAVVSDAYIMAQKADFDKDAYVWRNANIFVQEINMDGTIGRDASIVGKEIKIGDNAKINEKLSYVSNNEATVSENASIKDVEFFKTKEEAQEAEKSESNPAIDFVLDILNIFVKTLVIAFVLVSLESKFVKLRRSNKTAKDMLKYAGKGFAVLALVPIITVLCFISRIGISIGFILLMVYVVLLFITTGVASTEIAYRFLTKNGKVDVQNKNILLGSGVVAIIIEFIGKIPAIGSLIGAIVFLIGLGIIFEMVKTKTKNLEN